MQAQSHSSGLRTFEPTEKLRGEGFLCKRWEDRIYPPFIDIPAIGKLAGSWDTDEHDVFICTHQKVGTHLTKKFVVEILRSTHPYLSDHPMAEGDIGHGTVPWPEVMVSQHGFPHFQKHLDNTSGAPRVWYMHACGEDLPFRAIHPDSRFLAVIRDPRSVAVSQFFFYRSHPLLQVPADIVMDDFLELFLNGPLYFGDYHEHVLDWLSHCEGRIPADQLLVLRYEDLVENKPDSIRQIAGHIRPQVPLDAPTVASIAQSTEFLQMKRSISEKPGSFHFNPETFFRSGTTRDWEKHLRPDQVDAIDRKTNERWSAYADRHPILRAYLT